MESIEYGKPAEWAATQKWKRRGTTIQNFAYIAALALALAAVVAGVFYFGVQGEWYGITIIGVFASVSAVTGYKLYGTATESWKRAGQAKIGVQSERDVRRFVRKNKPLISMYGVKLGKRQGDVDLIVIDRQRKLLAVEIKTGFGKVSMYGNQVRAGKKLMPRDPHGQALKSAERLQKALNVPVLPVLCVVEMTNKPFVHQGVLICSAKDMFSAARHHGEPAFRTASDAQAAADYLWELNEKANS